MNVSDLIDPSFSYRLITTLMHFLWQGCLVALLAVLGDGLLSRASASRRYALHVAALAIMVACVAVTFSLIESPVSAPAVTVESTAMTAVIEPVAPGGVDDESTSMPSAAIVKVEMPPPEMPSVISAVEAVEPPIVRQEQPAGDGDRWRQLQRWAPQITLLYFVGCGLLLARLIRGSWVAHRLRRMATTVSDDSLIATLQRQSKELGLRVLPRIAWCAEVSIPLVIGVLKPMILLPAAAATGLSPDQLQALITHELAHIRRYDLLVNLAQRIVESMLFFHPAVWFISRRISNEREQACDELVLATGCERLRYADALVRMAELSSSLRRLGTSAPATSLAASGANSSEFKRRVLKVLSVPTNSQLRPSRIALLAIVALILGVTISASRLRLSAFAETQPKNAEDAANAGRGSPDPALDPTAGLPDSDKESNATDNANGDPRSSPAAGSGDTRRAQEIESIGQPKPMWCQPIKAPANAWPSEVGPLVVDERRVIIGEHVLDLRTGESLGRLTFGDFSLDFLRLSANRRYLLACGTHPKSFEGNFTFPSTLAEVWDLTTLKRVGSAFQVPHSIYDGHADVSQDGKVVVSGCREDVVLFDVATGKEINKLDVKSRRIDAVGFSPDGQWLVVSNQNDLTYWKWRTAEKPQTLHVGRTIISLAFSPDSRYLAEGPDCQVDIEIRDLQTLKVAHALRDEFGSPLYVKKMCFSSDGKRFIASNDVGVDETKLLIPHRLLAWELPTGRLKAKGSRPSQYGWGIGATPGGFYAVRANESNGLMAATWVLADNTAGADTPTEITPKTDVEWGPAVNGLKARAVPVLSSMSEDAIDPAQRVTMFERPEDVAFVVELENVSDKPIKLLDTRHSDNAKGKANSDWFGQFLFSIDLFDESGKLIEQPDVKVVDLDLALVGHQVATVEPGKSHRFLLRPARWFSPFKLPLDAGRFRAAVRYHGLSDRVTKRMKDYRPNSPQLTAVSGDITAPATTFAVRTFNGRSKRSEVKRETDPPRDGNDGSQAVPFDELVWGQPVNGLRAAMSFLPLQETHAHGEKPAVLLHLQNVGTQPLALLSKLSLPNAIAAIKNDKGEFIDLDAAKLLGERLNGLISLKPQQIVVLDAGHLGLAVTQERANAFDARTPRRLIAPAGKYSVQLEATFNNILHWERGQDKVLAKDAWVGKLQTGAASLTIVTAPPDGLGFLKPYPKLHGLSLDMTEPQFLEIVKQQELKTRKTVAGEKVTHHIALGDGHTLIVMFDKDAKCSGIQRVRGEDNSVGHFNGRVTGPDGKPLSRARVFVAPLTENLKTIGAVRAETDAEGRFEFDAPDMTYTNAEGRVLRRQGMLIVTADGFAADGIRTWGDNLPGFRSHSDPIEGAALNLRLAKSDVPIEGRFLNHDGTPLVGARVEIIGLMIPQRYDLDAHLAREVKFTVVNVTDYERELYKPSLLPGLVVETKTDAEGRFQLSGIGRDRLAWLKVSAPTVVDTELEVMTRDAPDVRTRLGDEFSNKSHAMIYGAKFTLPLKPRPAQTERFIRGRVLDADGKPVAGAEVVYPITWTDRAGSYVSVMGFSDQDGEYRLPVPLEWLPEKQSIRAGQMADLKPLLWVWASAKGVGLGVSQLRGNLSRSQQPESVDIKLRPRKPSKFQLLDPDKRPLAMAQCEITTAEVDGIGNMPIPEPFRISAQSDEEGRGLIELLPPDMFRAISISHPQFGRQLMEFTEQQAAAPLLQLTFGPATRVTGRIEAKTPEFFQGLQLRMQTSNERFVGPSSELLLVRVDEQGRFNIMLPHGRLQIIVERNKSEDFGPESLFIPTDVVIDASTKELTLRTKETIKIRGRLLNADDDQPLENAILSINEPHLGSQTPNINAQGEFEFRAFSGETSYVRVGSLQQDESLAFVDAQPLLRIPRRSPNETTIHAGTTSDELKTLRVKVTKKPPPAAQPLDAEAASDKPKIVLEKKEAQPIAVREGLIESVADKVVAFTDGIVIATDADTKYVRLTDKGEEPAERKELKFGVRVRYERAEGKGVTKVVILSAKSGAAPMAR